MILNAEFKSSDVVMDADLKSSDVVMDAEFAQVQSGYGENGKSAYEIAIDNGFEGTEIEWLASLRGKDGYTPQKNIDYFDGISPIVNIEKTGTVTTVTITDKNGNKTFDINDGADGYTPVKDVDYRDGQDGDDGIGIKSITRTSGTGAPGTTDTYTITMTDGSKTTFTVYNGLDGEKGDAFTYDDFTSAQLENLKGKDGTSVTVKSVTESIADGGNNVVTFSDGKTITIKNGSNGKTPVQGTDYWTDKDKAEIKAYVDEAILNGKW